MTAPDHAPKPFKKSLALTGASTHALRPPMPETLKKTDRDAELGLTLPLDRTASQTFDPEVFYSWRGKQRMRVVDRPVTEADRVKYMLPDDAHTIRRMEPWPEAQDRADQILKAWDDWQARLEKAEIESGLAKAKDESNRLSGIEREFRRQITHIPARTQEGLAVKARVYAWLLGGPDELDRELTRHLETNGPTDEAIMLAIARDLLRAPLSA